MISILFQSFNSDGHFVHWNESDYAIIEPVTPGLQGSNIPQRLLRQGVIFV